VSGDFEPWCNVQDLQGNVVGGLGIAWSVLRGRLAYTMSIKVYSSTTQSAATCKPRLEPVAPHTAISIFADLAFLPVGPGRGRGRGLWVLNCKGGEHGLQVQVAVPDWDYQSRHRHQVHRLQFCTAEVPVDLLYCLLVGGQLRMCSRAASTPPVESGAPAALLLPQCRQWSRCLPPTAAAALLFSPDCLGQ